MAMSPGVAPLSTRQQWQFGVEIGGFTAAYFDKVSGLEVDFGISEFNPAGSAFPMRTAGRAKFSDVTLSKGVLQENLDSYAMSWVKAVLSVVDGTGNLPSRYMQDVDIVEYDRAGKEIRRIRLYGAWPSKVKLPDNDGSKEDVAVEEITLTYQYFDQVNPAYSALQA